MMNNQFRSAVVRGAPEAVENRIIRRAKVMEAGDLNDSRPLTIDQMTLEQVAEHGNAATRGIKSRWTHPSMSSDGLGSAVGRARNFRVEGDAVYADIHVLKSSDHSPRGNIGQYVLDLAEEDPESFGMSVVVDFTDELAAELGDIEPGEKLPLRLKGLRAVDFVDEPAATRGGLFDIHDKRDLAPVVSSLISEHFEGVPRKEVVARLLGFLSLHYGEDVMADVAAENAGQDQQQEAAPATVATPAPAAMSLEAAQPFMVAFGDRGAKWFLEGKTMAECLSIVNKEIGELNADLQKQVDDLQARLSAVDLGEAAPVSAAPANELTPEQRDRARLRAELAKKGADERTLRWAGAFASKTSN